MQTWIVGAGSNRAEIIAEFNLANADEANTWLQERSLESDETLSFRRVLSKEGRSRNFINGTAVTLASSNMASYLVDIHAQHEHHQLGRNSTARDLDAFASVDLTCRTRRCWPLAIAKDRN